MQPLGLHPTGTLPRFNGLLYVAQKPNNRKQPKVTAFIQDFSHTLAQADSTMPRHDGTVLFQSPSGKLHVLEENNPAVAELTEACLKANCFKNKTYPDHSRNMLRAIWRDMKALFVSGMFPITVQEDERGERLYESLMESEFKKGYLSLEQLLTTPLGYDYEAKSATVHTYNGQKPTLTPSTAA